MAASAYPISASSYFFDSNTPSTDAPQTLPDLAGPGAPGLTPLPLASTPEAWAADAPALLLANVYRPGMPLADYWVSEKYDGVRGYWDGHTLCTRGGETVAGTRVVYRRLAHHAHGR